MRQRNEHRRLESRLAQPLAALVIALVAAVGAIAQVGLWGDATTLAYGDEGQTAAASRRAADTTGHALSAVTARSAVTAQGARPSQPAATHPRSY